MDFQKSNFKDVDVLQILKLYPFKHEGLKISYLNGVANDNYRVSGVDFDIVIKVYSHGQSDRRKIEKEVEAVKLFGHSGIKVPKLIRGKNNKILQKYKGFNITAASFIEGKLFDSIEFTKNLMLGVGSLIAKVEEISKELDVSSFQYTSFKEEFEYVSKNLETELIKRKYNFDMTIYLNNLKVVNKIIEKLDNSTKKQFLHKDIWPWNLIDAKDGIYLLDFNDWAIGDPIVELSVSLLEFGMFKTDKFNFDVARNILKGYKHIKSITYSAADLWEGMLFICYLYFPYNVIQADDVFESEIYLKRIKTLLENRDLLAGLL